MPGVTASAQAAPGAWHNEIWKCYQVTSEAWSKLLRTFRVCGLAQHATGCVDVNISLAAGKLHEDTDLEQPHSPQSYRSNSARGRPVSQEPHQKCNWRVLKPLMGSWASMGQSVSGSQRGRSIL